MLISFFQRQRTHYFQGNVLHDISIELPSLHNLEETTAKIARKIVLDLNDSELLIDHMQSVVSNQASAELRDKKEFGGKSLSQRYNISNDEAYDLLKENHQQKIRGTLGHQAIEHSLPALRLQWPFVCESYKLFPIITNFSKVQDKAGKARSSLLPSPTSEFYSSRKIYI